MVARGHACRGRVAQDSLSRVEQRLGRGSRLDEEQKDYASNRGARDFGGRD